MRPSALVDYFRRLFSNNAAINLRRRGIHIGHPHRDSTDSRNFTPRQSRHSNGWYVHILSRRGEVWIDVNFQRRKGVSVVIATLLMIAITVAAGIVVYVFVTGLVGSLSQSGGTQVTELLQLQSYNFQISPGTCACPRQVIELFLLNSGAASTTISAMYYDGTLLTLSTPFTAATALSTINNNAYTAPSTTTLNDFTTAACTATAGPAGSMCFTSTTAKTSYSVGDVGQVVITFSSAVGAGTSHTVKAVSTTGAAYIFTIQAGKSG